MAVMYSDPVKNADINKSKAALVELIDELRTRFARKNDESARRLALLRRCFKALRYLALSYPAEVYDYDPKIKDLLVELAAELKAED